MSEEIKEKTKPVWWHYIILVGIILFITALIINSSAKTDYDYKTQTYTIREGLGEDIATVRLIYNTDRCISDDCYAIMWIQPHINISLKDKTTNLKFYNKQGKEINIKKSEITRTIEEEYIEEVFDKYKDICEKDKIINNITGEKEKIEYSCNPIYKNKTFKKEKKVEFTLDSFLEEGKDYYIRIDGEKNPGESVEWILTFYGQELDDWAWWIDEATFRYLLNVTDADSTNYPYGVNFTFDINEINCSLATNGSNMWIVNSTNGSVRWYNSTSFGANTVIWFKYENLSNTNLSYSMYCGGSGTEIPVTEGEIFGLSNSTAFPDLISSWHFDEGSGSSWIDYTSYYDANVTLGNWNCSSSFTGASGKCVNGTHYNMYGDIHGIEYGSPKFTLMAWLLAEEGQRSLSGVFSRNRATRFYFGMDDSEQFRILTSGGQKKMTTQYNDSIWHNWIITYDGSDFKGYIDGVQTSELDWNTGLGADLVSTKLLAFSTSSYNPWDSLADEMVWFNNTINYEIINISARNYAPTLELSTEDTSIVIEITTTLDAPADNYASTETNLSFKCNASVIFSSLKNISINIWNSTERYYVDVDDIGGTSNQSNWSLTSIPEGAYTWNCEAWEITEIYYDWDTNRTFSIDTTAPTITIDIPIDNQEFFNYDPTSLNTSLNYTVFDLNLDVCWYEFNKSNTTLSSCENTTFFSGDGLKNITVYVNDTFGYESNESNNFYVNYISNVSISYNESVVETTSQTFTLFLNATNTSYVNASLIYNNTNYNYTSKTINPTNATIISTILIPKVHNLTSNLSFYWNYTLYGFNSSVTNQSATYGQNVSQFRIIFCNATINQSTLNFTFKDEGNLSQINGSIDIDFTYWYLDISKNRTYSYSDSNKNNYTFCIYPPWASGYTNYDVYYSGDGYPQRKDIVTNLALTNTSQDKFLYLLKSADGIYVRFVTVNSLNQPITSVDVLMEKDISGTYTIMEREITDDAGLATFWVDPDDTYRFTFTKTGYETQITTLRPTSTEIYYVTMETGVVIEINESVWHGISYIIEVNTTDNILINDSNYRFNFNISSIDSHLQSYLMNIYNDSDILLGTASGTTAAGGNISVDINTGKANYIYGKFFFTANYTTKEITKNWEVMYYEYKGDYSVMVFFEDFRNLTIGGFNTFTRLLICFIVIFIITCVLSYKVGVYSSKGIIGMIMVLVTIFSLVGFLTTDAAIFPGSVKTQQFLAQYSVAFIVNIILASAIIFWRPMEET